MSASEPLIDQVALDLPGRDPVMDIPLMAWSQTNIHDLRRGEFPCENPLFFRGRGEPSYSGLHVTVSWQLNLSMNALKGRGDG